MTKANKLTIGRNIKFSSQGGKIGGLSIDGDTLKKCNGQPFVTLTSEVARQVRDASEAWQPMEFEEKFGGQITDAERDLGWQFVGVVGDAHGKYQRLVRAADAPVEIFFAKEDVVEIHGKK